LKKEKKKILVLCVCASSYLREIQSIRVCAYVSMCVCVVSEKDEEVQKCRVGLDCRKMIKKLKSNRRIAKIEFGEYFVRVIVEIVKGE
jgi:hypothetical protein